MNCALITGGLGFIGSNLVKLLLKKKVVKKCVILDSYTGYINPLSDSYSDLRLRNFLTQIN